MNELKPCPICGRQPCDWIWNNGYMIECHQADHRVMCEAKCKEDAIKAWNRREGDPE